MQSSIPDQSPETPTQRLASMLLGEDVRQWVQTRRNDGIALRYIARELADATNGQVDVTHETLRNWVPAPAAAAS